MICKTSYRVDKDRPRVCGGDWCGREIGWRGCEEEDECAAECKLCFPPKYGFGRYCCEPAFYFAAVSLAGRCRMRKGTGVLYVDVAWICTGSPIDLAIVMLLNECASRHPVGSLLGFGDPELLESIYVRSGCSL
jgi:hypothetical protein